MKTVMFLLILTNILTLFQPPSYDEKIWLIGFSEENMMPLLDGAEISVKTGETIFIKVINGGGEVTLKSPTGETRILQLRDKEVVVLKEYVEDDEEGEWIVETDNGIVAKIIHSKPSNQLNAVVVTEVMSGSDVAVRISTPDKGFAFFIQNGTYPVYHPGDEITIPLTPPVYFRYRIDLISPDRRIELKGTIPNNVSYSLQGDGIVMSMELSPIIKNKEENTWILRITLPELYKTGKNGFIPLQYGEYTLRILKKLRGVFELEKYVTIAVVPKEIPDGTYSKEIIMRAGELLDEKITMVIGAENGEYRKVTISPPLARVKIVTQKGEEITQATINMANSQLVKDQRTNQSFLIFYRSIRINNPPTTITPIREEKITILVDGFVVKNIDPSPISFKAGENITIKIKIHRLEIRLFKPTEEPFREEAVISIDGKQLAVKNGYVSLMLEEGEHVISSINPPSLTETKINLAEDTALRITVYDEIPKIASLLTLIIIQIVFFTILLRRHQPPIK